MAAVGSLRRFDVVLVTLDPTQGAEMRKTRPCVVISPDEVNLFSRTVVVAPLTTGSHAYPTRIACNFEGTAGHVVVDQLRAVDVARVVRRLGAIEADVAGQVLAALQAFFAG